MYYIPVQYSCAELWVMLITTVLICMPMHSRGVFSGGRALFWTQGVDPVWLGASLGPGRYFWVRVGLFWDFPVGRIHTNGNGMMAARRCFVSWPTGKTLVIHTWGMKDTEGKTCSVVTGAGSLKTVCAGCCFPGVKGVKPFPAAVEPLGKVSRRDGSGNVTRPLHVPVVTETFLFPSGFPSVWMRPYLVTTCSAVEPEKYNYPWGRVQLVFFLLCSYLWITDCIVCKGRAGNSSLTSDIVWTNRAMSGNRGIQSDFTSRRKYL